MIGLLQKNPSKRLTIDEIKKHPFFRTVNWEDIKTRKNNPPLKEYVEKNDHIRFRDPTNDSENSHRVIKFTGSKEDLQYKANLYEFRNSG
jgi:serine/threonine protein kinase